MSFNNRNNANNCFLAKKKKQPATSVTNTFGHLM